MRRSSSPPPFESINIRLIIHEQFIYSAICEDHATSAELMLPIKRLNWVCNCHLLLQIEAINLRFPVPFPAPERAFDQPFHAWQSVCIQVLRQHVRSCGLNRCRFRRSTNISSTRSNLKSARFTTGQAEHAQNYKPHVLMGNPLKYFLDAVVYHRPRCVSWGLHFQLVDALRAVQLKLKTWS